ncbi:MAG: lipopolysaccharide biosynthesis protein [Chitinophagaceae bacterium]|nr:MAG: lipopolysaccharide biosynthesis protein [Chitinophagaceae bacterium]
MRFLELRSKLGNKHFLSLAGNGIMAVLGVVTVGLLYHNLSAREAGAYVFFQASFALVDTIRTGFLQTALIKFYTGTSEERGKEVMGSIWVLATGITLLSFVITIPGLFLLPYIDNVGLKLTVEWFSLLFAITLPIVLTSWVLQAKGDFGSILFIRLVNQGGFILMIGALIAMGKLNLFNAIAANFLSSLLTALIVFIRGWTNISSVKQRSRACMIEICHFGKYSMGTTISSNLLRSSDTFIINFMLGPAAVAIYNLPQRLMEIIEIPLRSFMATGITSLSAASNRNKPHEVGEIMKKYAGTITLVIIPVAIVAIIFADSAVALLGGAKYVGTEAANVFRIFMLFGILFPIERFQGVTLDMIHKPHLNLIKMIMMLAVNISGDFIGLHFLGNIYGVALASIPTFLCGLIFGYIALKKYIDHGFTDFFRAGFREWKLLVAPFFPRIKTIV